MGGAMKVIFAGAWRRRAPANYRDLHLVVLTGPPGSITGVVIGVPTTLSIAAESPLKMVVMSLGLGIDPQGDGAMRRAARERGEEVVVLAGTKEEVVQLARDGLYRARVALAFEQGAPDGAR